MCNPGFPNEPPPIRSKTLMDGTFILRRFHDRKREGGRTLERAPFFSCVGSTEVRHQVREKILVEARLS